MDRYSHVVEEQDREAAVMLAEMIVGTGQKGDARGDKYANGLKRAATPRGGAQGVAAGAGCHGQTAKVQT